MRDNDKIIGLKGFQSFTFWPWKWQTNKEYFYLCLEISM